MVNLFVFFYTTGNNKQSKLNSGHNKGTHFVVYGLKRISQKRRKKDFQSVIELPLGTVLELQTFYKNKKIASGKLAKKRQFDFSH